MKAKDRKPAINITVGYIVISIFILTFVGIGINKVCKTNSEYEANVKANNSSSTVITEETEYLPTQDEVEKAVTKTTTTPTTTSVATTKPKKKATTKKVTTKKAKTETFTEKEYKAQVTEQDVEQVKEQDNYPTESERILLANLVGREYGSDYVSVEEKAKVVAVVMNRVNSPQFPNNIWDVIHQSGQFEDCYTSCWDLSNAYYSYQVTDSVVQAVDYYFNNTWAFDSNIMYYYGDGSYNYFY